MRTILLSFCGAASLLAQFIQTPAAAGIGAGLRGDYHFVQMQLRPTVATAAGTITFDGAGGVKMKLRSGTGKEAAAEVPVADGRYQASAADFVITLTNPLDAASQIQLRFNEGATALLGGSEKNADLFVAVKAPAGGAAGNGLLNGAYGVAHLSVANGENGGLATSFAEVTANGAGAFTKTSLVNHVASFDETNRLEERTGSTYKIGADGAGTARFEGPSETLSGERAIFTSAAGDMLLGISTAAGQREILLGVKRNQELAMFTFNAAYWIHELLAETEFAIKPQNTRLGAASGRLKADGAGNVLVSQMVRMEGGAATEVTSVNKYLVGLANTSAFGAGARYGVLNFAVSPNSDAFAGAQVGAPGEMTLDHGVFFALRMPMAAVAKMAPPAVATGMVSAFHADGAPVSAARPAAPGDTLTLAVASPPAAASGISGAVKVLFAGKPAESASIQPGNRIQVKVPAQLGPAPSGSLPVAIQTAASFIDVLDLPVAPSPGK